MARTKINKDILRIIDANINRLKEGLRVCEDEVRFILCNENFTRQFKEIRHKISALIDKAPIKISELLNSRDSRRDVGKKSLLLEFGRNNYRDIFFANIQRSKESIRVLEEFFKLIDKKISLEFKNLRYKIYDLEQKTIKKLQTICNIR